MIKPLTSLRFFFAFFVFLSHLAHLREGKYSSIFNKVFSEGFWGVGFFFILSGFILALNYREKFKNNTITLRKFYVARFARIYPLHFITLLVSIPVFQSGIKALVCNVLLIQSYIPDIKFCFSYNGPSWSISAEAFFYALFPLLIKISYKFRLVFKVILLVAFVLLILLLNMINASYWMLYISPLTRVFDFLLGILLFDVALYLKDMKLTLSKNTFITFQIGSLIVLALFFGFKDHIPISYRYSVYYWLPMCLVVISAASTFISGKGDTWITKFLSLKYFFYLGEISFAFYMIHYIVIAILYLLNKNGIMGIHLKDEALVLLMFVITLAASILAYEKIEKPFNKKIKSLFS